MHLYKILSLILLFFIGCNQQEAVNFIEIDSPADENSSLPRLYTDEANNLFMSWVEQKEDISQLRYSTFNGTSWEESKIIAEDSTWFINWADYPSIISSKGKPMAAHWLNKKPGGTYSYDVNISTNDNGSWNPAFTPHQDETATEHGFASMIPMSDSTFLAVWLDGRETDVRSHDDYSDIEQAMTLRGAVIHKDGSILHKYLIDDSVCDCCNTSLAKTDEGDIILVYRNRTDEEIRDIYFSKLKDGVWSEPKPIHKDNWKIAACPVNGPSVSSDKNIVAMAWFTGANDESAVKLSISTNLGTTFSEAIPIDTDGAIGRVDIDVVEDQIIVSWLNSANQNDVLKISTFSSTGKPIQTYSFFDVSAERRAGFPQLEVFDSNILVAFTEVNEEKKNVKTVTLSTN